MQTQIPEICVRKAKDEDAPGILKCLREAFEEFRSRYTPQGFLDTVLTAETLRVRRETMNVFVAVNSANEVLGTIACGVVSPEEGHLRGMAVLPSIRGNGVAAQLLRQAEQEMLSRGCARVTLDTTAVTKLNRWLNWQVSFNDRYLSHPLPGVKKNDTLLTTGFHVTFGSAR